MTKPITLEEEDRGIILGALLTLAECLALHSHIWTEGERAVFEQAVTMLGGDAPGFTKADGAPPDDPADHWKKG